MKYKFVGWGLGAVLSATLVACGGGGGGGEDTGTGAGAAVGSGGSATVAVQTPTGPAIDAATLTADQWAALSLTGAVSGVTISSPPVVNFQVTDASGRGVSGLTQKDSKGGYANLAFAIAKLKPADAATGYPNRWISYMVVTTPAASAAAVPGFPETENDGTLVDNKDGTYTYTFALDLKKVQSYVDGATYDANHVKADLDDLTYEPNLPHRLFISAGGYQSGTTTLSKTSAAITFDFIPATGKVLAATDQQRLIVDIASCNECHSQLSMHERFFPPIQDTKLCVVCHTEQQKYGSGDTLPATGNTLVPAGAYAAYGATLKLQGRALPNFPNMVHKIHMGEDLFYQGYNQFGVKYNEVTYPQTKTNCVKCHDGSATATHPTPQGDNWKKVPSRLACGACHDGINFATGKGVTVKDAEDGLTTSTFGHIGGIQNDDSKCALCHSADAIPLYHVTVDRKGSADRGGYPVNTAQDTPTVGFPAGQGPAIPLQSQINSPAGVYKMNYEIKQVTVTGASGAKKATVVYRILKDGSPVTLNATGALITGLDGSPNIMLAWAVPQDGIASPSDWNVALDLGGGAKVIDIRDGKNGHSQTGPDASGYYTATLGNIVPDNATMVTAAMPIGYQNFVQLDHPDYPMGIRLREPKFVMKTADGYTARRSVVDGDKCNKCHGQLGVKPSFHSGARNNGAGCVLCHNPNRATGHVGSRYQFGGGWFVGAKNLIHSIHASAKREQKFNYLQDEGTKFDKVTYPGILKKCETCHLPGTYDFSASASSAALPNLLWATDVTGDMTNNATTNPTNITPVGQNPWIKLIGDGEVDYRADNLVSSPIASACFGCHDSSLAVQHMQSNGGTLLKRFSSVSSLGTSTARPMPTAAGVGNTTVMSFTKVEQCTLCHLANKVADIKAMHAK